MEMTMKWISRVLRFVRLVETQTPLVDARRALEQRFQLGSWVIGCSNEWENMVIGPVTGYSADIEMVQDLVSGKELMMVCPMVGYSPRHLAVLSKMTPYERFDLLSKNHKIRQKTIPALPIPLWSEAQYQFCVRQAGLRVNCFGYHINSS